MSTASGLEGALHTYTYTHVFPLMHCYQQYIFTWRSVMLIHKSIMLFYYAPMVHHPQRYEHGAHICMCAVITPRVTLDHEPHWLDHSRSRTELSPK